MDLVAWLALAVAVVSLALGCFNTWAQRQTFSIYYKRTEEHGWDYDRIKETTPDAP